jgi:hypothetical protein
MNPAFGLFSALVIRLPGAAEMTSLADENDLRNSLGKHASQNARLLGLPHPSQRPSGRDKRLSYGMFFGIE